MKILQLVPRYRICNRLAAVFILILSPSVLQAFADNYPSRTVTFVVPFSAGSITDTVARFIANDLQTALHGTFIVENKPGAEGLTRVSTSRTLRQTATLYFSRRIPPNLPRRVFSSTSLMTRSKTSFRSRELQVFLLSSRSIRTARSSRSPN